MQMVSLDNLHEISAYFICMKYESLFSRKDDKSVKKRGLLQFFLSMISVKELTGIL